MTNEKMFRVGVVSNQKVVVGPRILVLNVYACPAQCCN